MEDVSLQDRDHRISHAERSFLRESYKKIEGEPTEAKPNKFRFNLKQVKELSEQENINEFDVELVADGDGIKTVVLSCAKEGVEAPMLLELALPCPPLC